MTRKIIFRCCYWATGLAGLTIWYVGLYIVMNHAQVMSEKMLALADNVEEVSSLGHLGTNLKYVLFLIACLQLFLGVLLFTLIGFIGIEFCSKDQKTKNAISNKSDK